MKTTRRIGIDIGSTTLKTVIMDAGGSITRETYKRHGAEIDRALSGELEAIAREFPGERFTARLTGSAGMGISERVGLPFIQEVIASIVVAREVCPAARVLVDLGGEDAKIVFLDNARPDIRMNGNCAGGTGAFIDQMATLMNITPGELDALARRHEKLYPVASRCGVFAKTDVQDLLARAVPLPDVSASILRAVAMQAITTLARGRAIHPPVLCTGGPLTFLPSLREAFREVLQVGDGLILPAGAEFFPARGAARHDPGEAPLVDPLELARALDDTRDAARGESLPPLFAGEEEHEEWLKNRNVKHLPRLSPSPGQETRCFIGIDSGSTTTKIAVIDEHANLLHEYYATNAGNPLGRVREGLEQFYREASERGCTVRVLSSAATGYGEELVRSSLDLDHGLVETMAHLLAARHVDPDVTFVLDVGGQDMKAIFAGAGGISDIELNEACSSGCGSFLQYFAAAINLSLPEFTRAACLARHPADLGSRCTVFMNSRVKQASRENAAPADIAAGLAYSVVKNCLFKVLKAEKLERLGEHIVVQGGTFCNDAVYRALELLSGKRVSSTDRPGLMGAFGAALHARAEHAARPRPPRHDGALPLPPPGLPRALSTRCEGCGNRCAVLRYTFPNGNTCHAGNKCEKIFHDKKRKPTPGYNAFDFKNELLFNRPRLPGARLTLGIPRALNMYEHYPFWHALFTACGIDVLLSPPSTPELYRAGINSVMSDNICFPAKLAHGHLLALLDAGVHRVFYPIVIKEERDLPRASNSYNCPVVSGYPDVLRSAIDPAIPLDKPVITFHDPRALEQGCVNYLRSLGVSARIAATALRAAREEQSRVTGLLRQTQRDILDRAARDGETLFVVAGRPYHADPLVHQKVARIISDLGVHALTEDVFRGEERDGIDRLEIVTQWAYPNRAVQAALAVASLPANIQLVQLNSFGCGPDAFFINETGEILQRAGKTHTVIRIDEIAAPGPLRLRLRSLVASAGGFTPRPAARASGYRREDRGKKILVPWFSDFLSPFIPAIGAIAGHDIENLPPPSPASAATGARYTCNEACYPLTLVAGDIIRALQSGKHDLANTVVAITQTGGQCRATNYLSQLKSALRAAGFAGLPVVVIAAGEVYQNEQKAFTFPLARVLLAVTRVLPYADALRQARDTLVTREILPGESQRVFDKYIARGVELTRRNDARGLPACLARAIADFNAIATRTGEPPVVGLVGEIYAKYNEHGQAYIAKWLQARGVEVVTSPALDFLEQYFVNRRVNARDGLARTGPARRLADSLFHARVEASRREIDDVARAFRYHRPRVPIEEKARYAAEILDLAEQFGEGWLIAAEIACLYRAGIHRVICVQPFGCIANHVVAKGIENRMKKLYPGLTVLFLDVDAGTTEVNLHNRLYFLVEEARKQPVST
ncbi:MAG: acyl-CoA dehydratase activase-related protein [Odoribacteraceae bacterium]|jgi:activator of 2-hydroxyglutaryl-CoA dehydratase/predicted nucleotide-binding protein (sugar kinase/HSP70/actin superfamily)|nr:acyl-CoA dehydratase activase-related protein [Odoribacteraceae bacterium]